MANIPPVYIEFKGDVTGLQSALKTVQGDFKVLKGEIGKTEKVTESLKISTIALGSVMGNVITSLGSEVTKFGKEFVSAFTDTVSETKTLQKVLGGTPEEMSRLAFAATSMGVDINTVSGFMARLSGHLSANDKAAQKLGVRYRDTNGDLLSSQQVLFNLSDRFAGMPAGIDRTALALKTFGRSGQAMLPILALGSEGLKKMYETADEFGLTLNTEGMIAAKNYNVAIREMHHEIKGMQLSIGKQLVPHLTDAIYVMRNGVDVVKNFIEQNKTLIKVVLTLGGALTFLYLAVKTYTGTKEALKSMREAWLALSAAESTVTWPLIGMIVAIAAVVAAFVWAYRNIKVFAEGVQTAIDFVATAVGYAVKAVATYIKFMVDIYMKAIGLIIKGAQMLAPILNKAGIHILDGADSWASGFNKIKNTIDGTLDSIKNNSVSVAQKLGNSFGDALDKAMNFDPMSYLASLREKYKYEMPDVSPTNVDVPGLGTGGSKSARRKAAKKAAEAQYKAYMEEIKKINLARGTIDAQFALATAGAGSAQERLAVAKEFVSRASALVKTAQAEEKKTRGTKAHAAAVVALNSAIKEQAKLQTAVAKATKAAADETARMNNEIARLNSSYTANNSWLAAQTRSAGPQRDNFGGFIEVPVVIDGQVVFRATQKYSLQNNRRNVSNGLATSGSLI